MTVIASATHRAFSGCLDFCCFLLDARPKVAPDEFVSKYKGLQKLKKIKSVVEEVKQMAKEAAAKEAKLEF